MVSSRCSPLMRAARSPDRTQTTAGAISHRRPDRTYSTPSWCEPDRRPSARPIRRSAQAAVSRRLSQNARPKRLHRIADRRHAGWGASRLSLSLTTPRGHHRPEVGGRQRADLVVHPQIERSRLGRELHDGAVAGLRQFSPTRPPCLGGGHCALGLVDAVAHEPCGGSPVQGYKG